MKAAEVLDALDRHHRDAAIVREVVVNDDGAYDDLLGGVARPSFIRRIDGLMFSSLQRTAIEVKVSVPDFRRETYAKQRAWTRCTHRFVFAVPAGLIDSREVALEFYGAGLWWVHTDGQVEVRRKAKVNPYPEPLPQQVVQSLAYRAARRRQTQGAS